MEMNCQIVSYSCPSWQNFTNGLCGECTNDFPCRHVGIGDHLGISIPELVTNQTNNPYPMFVILNSRIDFCLMHYQLIVKISGSHIKTGGKLYIKIENPLKDFHMEEMEENFMPRENYTRLIIRNPDDGALFDVRVEIFWIPDISYENMSIDIEIIQFRFMSHIDER